MFKKLTLKQSYLNTENFQKVDKFNGYPLLKIYWKNIETNLIIFTCYKK